MSPTSLPTVQASVQLSASSALWAAPRSLHRPHSHATLSRVQDGAGNGAGDDSSGDAGAAAPNATRTRRAPTALVRFTPEELAAARERARAAGRPLAVYLREAALRTVPKARAGHQSDELLHQLSRAATALQAISRGAGDMPATTASSDGPALGAILGDLVALMRRVAATTGRGA
jgi:hypothetical protein